MCVYSHSVHLCACRAIFVHAFASMTVQLHAYASMAVQLHAYASMTVQLHAYASMAVQLHAYASMTVQLQCVAQFPAGISFWQKKIECCLVTFVGIFNSRSPKCTSKTLPLWNLYFHSPAINTTSIVIQG